MAALGRREQRSETCASWAGGQRWAADPVWGFSFTPLVSLLPADVPPPGKQEVRWPDNRPRSSDSHLQTGAVAPAAPLRALRRLRGCAFQALSFPATHPCLAFALVCRSQSAIISPRRPAVGVSSSPWFPFLTCMVKCCRTAGAGPVGGFALSLSLYYALPYWF